MKTLKKLRAKIQKWAGGSPRRRPHSVRPGLESLERRDLMATAIASLFNTGVDNTGKPLAGNQADPHYAITAAPAPDAPGAAQVVIQNGFPITDNWMPNGTASMWIAPHANENDYPGKGGTTEPVGDYTYETTFSLKGLDPSTAVISGQFAADNRLVKVLLNGTDVGVSSNGLIDPLLNFQPFIITTGFVPGQNKLDFVVENYVQPAYAGNLHNPSGLRVEMTGTADPAVIKLNRVFTTDSKSLNVKYTVQGDDGSVPLLLDVYRSDAGRAGSAKQVLIAEVSLTGQYATDGSREYTIAPGGFKQDNALRPDPTHQFVVVTLDGNGALIPADAKAPPQRNFHIFLIGAVTQGFTLPDSISLSNGITASEQPWVDTMTEILTADKYNAVIPFHWEQQSFLPQAGWTILKGQELANKVILAAQGLTPGPNDVVDVHFIGHSRGSVVISQALLDLQATPNLYQPLKAGYNIMTMLDPHSANNAYSTWSPPRPAATIAAAGLSLMIPLFPLGTLPLVLTPSSLVGAFQDLASDPNVIVPSNVQQADDWYQNSYSSELSLISQPKESLGINLWGETPGQLDLRAPGLTVEDNNLSASTGKTVNGLPMGHSEVVDYYLNLLGNTADTAKMPPEIKPF